MISILHFIGYLNYIIGGSVLLICSVQLLNWFSKKNIAYILSLWLWAQGLGYITWINIDIMQDDKKFAIAGIFFFCLAILDYFFFVYTPT